MPGQRQSRQHPSRTGPSRWRGCNHRSHDNLQQDLADRRMANPMDPVLSHHTSQERQPAAMPELPNNKPHQSPKQKVMLKVIPNRLKSVLHCPLGLGELQAWPFPDVVFPLIFLSALFFSHFFLVLHRPLGPAELQAWPFPDVVFPSLSLSALSSSLFTVPCKMVLARPEEQEIVHTTSVCISLRWSGGLCVVRMPAESWHRLPR